MTARAVVVAAVAFVATGISVDPRVRASSYEAQVQVVADVAGGSEDAGMLADVPTDVTVGVAPDRVGAHQVIVRRKGYLVSLRDERARAAGVDWAVVQVAAVAPGGQVAGSLVWETTKLDGTETERGVVRLHGDASSIMADLGARPAPVTLSPWQGKHASCVSQEDGFAGFTVFCRFAKGVRVTGVANVTSPRALDDAWLVKAAHPGESALVRLDLPHSEGGAEGRVVGLVRGTTGVVLTVEASFPEGDPPTLVFNEAVRAQPTP